MTRILLEGPLRGDTVPTVTGEELHYLTRVRRHVTGDTVQLQDLDGRRFQAQVATIERSAATFTVTKTLPMAPPGHPVTLLVSVPKRTLMEEIVRSVSELGVARVVPVICERTVVTPRETKVERWRKIAWESRRQCGRRTPLMVTDVTSLEAALADVHTAPTGTAPTDTAPTRFLLDTDEDGNRSPWPTTPLQGPVVAIIGPEGGFTSDEQTQARGHGFAPITLGQHILRLETAAITVSALAIAGLGGFR